MKLLSDWFSLKMGVEKEKQYVSPGDAKYVRVVKP